RRRTCMKRWLLFAAAILALVVLIGTLPHRVNAQDQQSQLTTPVALDRNQPQPIPVEQIEALIENLTSGHAQIRKTRVTQFGQTAAEPEDARIIERTSATFDPLTQSITVTGVSGGQPVVEDIHLYSMDESVYVVRDLYMNPD